MSFRHLSYPAQKSEKRHFHPLKLIRKSEKVGRDLFALIFDRDQLWERMKIGMDHAIVPIAIDVAIPITGHSYMFVRSCAVLVCAVWLSISAGVSIFKSKWKKEYKGAIFSLTTCFFFCISMGVMYWFLVSTLEDQQVDVATHLTAADPLIPLDGDVSNTHFAIKNGSSMRIDGLITCNPRSVVDSAENVFHDGILSSTDMAPIDPGGDAATSDCLRETVGGKNTVTCADVDLMFLYRLETQPLETKQINYRFVGFRDSAGFQWRPEGNHSGESRCRILAMQLSQKRLKQHLEF